MNDIGRICQVASRQLKIHNWSLLLRRLNNTFLLPFCVFIMQNRWLCYRNYLILLHLVFILNLIHLMINIFSASSRVFQGMKVDEMENWTVNSFFVTFSSFSSLKFLWNGRLFLSSYFQFSSQVARESKENVVFKRSLLKSIQIHAHSICFISWAI